MNEYQKFLLNIPKYIEPEFFKSDYINRGCYGDTIELTIPDREYTNGLVSLIEPYINEFTSGLVSLIEPYISVFLLIVMIYPRISPFIYKICNVINSKYKLHGFINSKDKLHISISISEIIHKIDVIIKKVYPRLKNIKFIYILIPCIFLNLYIDNDISYYICNNLLLFIFLISLIRINHY
jgi:hypothetical protein